MKISVCIATYNGEKYIAAQLESILCQLGSGDEVVISDDGSTDKTLDVIRSIGDERIYVFINEGGRSPAHNFENALRRVTGDIIFLSDQDDVWCDTKVAVVTNYLKSCELVVSDALVVDSDLNVLVDSFYQYNNSRPGLLKNIIKNSYLGCAMAFNKKVLEHALPFPSAIPMHDWWIGLIAEKYCKVYFAPEKLILHRRHDDNASPTAGKSPYSMLDKALFRAKMIRHLLTR